MTRVRSLGREDPLEEGMQPFQHSCLEHPMDRGVWGATVHGGAESGTTEATQQTGRPLAGSLLET